LAALVEVGLANIPGLECCGCFGGGDLVEDSALPLLGVVSAAGGIGIGLA
jgi:hypothetical protein